MSRKKMMTAAAAALLFTGLAVTDGLAAGGNRGSSAGHVGGRFGATPQEQLPLKSSTPQFNNPGARLALPQPGNPVQQLSPLGSVSRPYAPGIR